MLISRDLAHSKPLPTHTTLRHGHANSGVSMIFLLSGLSLRVDQLASAAKDLRLNAAIQVPR